MATLLTVPDNISVETAIQDRLYQNDVNMNTEIAAITAGSGVLVSSNDSTVGYLNGKLVAGAGVQFTEGSDGGNETLTLKAPGGPLRAQVFS